MRVWERVTEEPGEACGGCGQRQPFDAPVWVIYLPNLSPLRRRRIRCVACAQKAGEAVNEAELAQFVPAEREPLPPVVVPTFGKSGFKRFDARAAALPASDRE